MNRLNILHLASYLGGGTARYLEDLTHHNTAHNHFVLSIGTQDDVLFAKAQKRYYPLTLKADQQWQAEALQTLMQAVRPDIIHIHLFTASVLTAVDKMRQAWPIPYLVTLHDLNFYYADAFKRTDFTQLEPQDRAWQQRSALVLAAAEAVIVPSVYIQNYASQLVAESALHLIPHGIEYHPPHLSAATQQLASQLWQQSGYEASRPTIAIVGAIGPHKGRRTLQAILQTTWHKNYQWILIGYSDLALYPQAATPEAHCLVHGMYQEAELAGLLQFYAIDLVYFPNVMPESFSYTLSQVWSAGIPVLVTDCGALAERTRSSGRGFILTTMDDLPALETQLATIFAGSLLEPMRQVLHHAPIHEIETIPRMIEQTNDLYCQIHQAKGHGAQDLSLDELQPLLAKNLAYVNFRHELVQFSRDNYELLNTAHALQDSVQICQQQLAEEKQWGLKLAQDIATMQQQDIPALIAQLAASQAAGAQTQQQYAEIQRQYQTLATEHQQLSQQQQQLIQQQQQLLQTQQELATLYEQSRHWSAKLEQDIHLLKHHETTLRRKMPEFLFRWLLK